MTLFPPYYCCNAELISTHKYKPKCCFIFISFLVGFIKLTKIWNEWQQQKVGRRYRIKKWPQIGTNMALKAALKALDLVIRSVSWSARLFSASSRRLWPADPRTDSCLTLLTMAWLSDTDHIFKITSLTFFLSRSQSCDRNLVLLWEFSNYWSIE